MKNDSSFIAMSRDRNGGKWTHLGNTEEVKLTSLGIRFDFSYGGGRGKTRVYEGQLLDFCCNDEEWCPSQIQRMMEEDQYWGDFDHKEVKMFLR